MTKLALIFALPLIGGCVHWTTYNVDSNPVGSSIDVDDQNVCSETPCEIKLKCKHGRKYEVKAYPPHDGQKHFVAVKHVDPCQVDRNDVGHLTFDMNVETVEPTKNINIHTD